MHPPEAAGTPLHMLSMQPTAHKAWQPPKIDAQRTGQAGRARDQVYRDFIENSADEGDSQRPAADRVLL